MCFEDIIAVEEFSANENPVSGSFHCSTAVV
jgi:hypothetical protein